MFKTCLAAGWRHDVPESRVTFSSTVIGRQLLEAVSSALGALGNSISERKSQLVLVHLWLSVLAGAAMMIPDCRILDLSRCSFCHHIVPLGLPLTSRIEGDRKYVSRRLVPRTAPSTCSCRNCLPSRCLVD